MKISNVFAGCVMTVAALASVQNVAAQSQPEDKMVVAIFGGSLGQQLREIVNGCANPHGTDVTFVEGASSDVLAKVRAQKGNPQIDVFVANDSTFAQAKALDLMAKLDPAIVTNLANVRPGFLDADGYGQPYEINPVGFVYRHDKFEEAGIPAPTSWNVYLDERLAGRTIVFPPTNYYGMNLLVGLAQDHGKDERDISSAWTDLATLRQRDAKVVPTPGQAEDLATRGEGWIYVSSANRAHLLSSKGAPVSFSTAAKPISLTNYMAPVANSPNPVAAQALVNCMISEPVQERLVKDAAVVPVNTKVELTDEMMTRLSFEPGKPIPELYVLNIPAVNAQMEDWVERFNRTMSR